MKKSSLQIHPNDVVFEFKSLTGYVCETKDLVLVCVKEREGCELATVYGFNPENYILVFMPHRRRTLRHLTKEYVDYQGRRIRGMFNEDDDCISIPREDVSIVYGEATKVDIKPIRCYSAFNVIAENDTTINVQLVEKEDCNIILGSELRRLNLKVRHSILPFKEAYERYMNEKGIERTPKKKTFISRFVEGFNEFMDAEVAAYNPNEIFIQGIGSLACCTIADITGLTQPGNSSYCENAGTSVSPSYIWNRQQDGLVAYQTTTRFFLTDQNGTRMIETILDDEPIELMGGYSISEILGKIVVHKFNFSYVYEVYDLTGNTLKLKTVDFYVGDDLPKAAFIDNAGKVQLFEGFDSDGIKITGDFKIPYKGPPLSFRGSYDSGRAEDIIKYSKNYGIMPRIEVGPSLINFRDSCFGVCSVKIHSDPKDFPYLKGSRIERVRSDIYRTFERLYGSKYIKHFGDVPSSSSSFLGKKGPEKKRCQGFIQMFCFIRILKDTGSIYISDAILPVFGRTAKDLDFAFSYFTPSGISLNNGRLSIYGSEGDYNPIKFEFPVDKALEMCVHNTLNLNMKDYGYFIL